MSRISYRLANSGDSESLANLRREFLTEGGGDAKVVGRLAGAIRTYFSEMLSAGDFVAAVAVVGDEIIGTSGMVYDRHPPLVKNPTGLCPYIMNMYVRPEYRRRGVATKLLKMLIAEAGKSGAQAITLHHWAGKRNFYAQAGFHPRQREMVLALRSHREL